MNRKDILKRLSKEYDGRGLPSYLRSKATSRAMKRALVFLACLIVTAALAVFGGSAGFIAVALFAAPGAFLLPLYGVLALQRAGKKETSQ